MYKEYFVAFVLANLPSVIVAVNVTSYIAVRKLHDVNFRCASQCSLDDNCQGFVSLDLACMLTDDILSACNQNPQHSCHHKEGDVMPNKNPSTTMPISKTNNTKQ